MDATTPSSRGFETKIERPISSAKDYNKDTGTVDLQDRHRRQQKRRKRWGGGLISVRTGGLLVRLLRRGF